MPKSDPDPAVDQAAAAAQKAREDTAAERMANPGPVATDDHPVTQFHPMELPADPAARARIPKNLISTDPDVKMSGSIQGDTVSHDERLLAAMDARAAFTQPEPEDYEVPHLEAGQALVDARAASQDAAASGDERPTNEDGEALNKDGSVSKRQPTEVSDKEVGGGTSK